MAESNSPNAPRRASAAEKRRQAVLMRISGATYEDIGNALGISRQAAYIHVKTALEQTRLQTSEDTEALREIEKERLERMVLALTPKAQKGDTAAVDTVRKLSESLRKLLGLNMPERVDVTSGGEKIKSYIGWTPEEWAKDEPEE